MLVKQRWHAFLGKSAILTMYGNGNGPDLMSLSKETWSRSLSLRSTLVETVTEARERAEAKNPSVSHIACSMAPSTCLSGHSKLKISISCRTGNHRVSDRLDAAIQQRPVLHGLEPMEHGQTLTQCSARIIALISFEPFQSPRPVCSQACCYLTLSLDSDVRTLKWPAGCTKWSFVNSSTFRFVSNDTECKLAVPEAPDSGMHR